MPGVAVALPAGLIPRAPARSWRKLTSDAPALVAVVEAEDGAVVEVEPALALLAAGAVLEPPAAATSALKSVCNLATVGSLAAVLELLALLIRLSRFVLALP